MRKLRILLLALSLVGSLSAQTTYLSNTGNAANNGIFIHDAQWMARSFTTGANPDGYELNSVDLRMAGGSDPTFSLTLWTDSSAAPGTSIATFTVPASGGHFDLSAGYDLVASNTYWLVAAATTPVNFSTSRVWRTTEDTSVVALDDWAYGSAVGSVNSGASWSVSGNLFMFDVNATATASAVPEPSTYATFVGFAALGLVTWRRRRARV